MADRILMRFLYRRRNFRDSALSLQLTPIHHLMINWCARMKSVFWKIAEKYSTA